MIHTLSVLVENKPGALVRVCQLFARRGYNIESLSVGETLDPSVSRMTLVVRGEPFIIEQVIKQLHKLIDVIKVTDLSEENHVEREMLLLKVNAEPANRAEILRLGDIFRAKVVDVTPTTYTLELTGEESKIEGIIELLRPFGIQEQPALLPRLDMYYYQRAGRLEAWDTPSFSRHLMFAQQRRRLRSLLNLTSRGRP